MNCVATTGIYVIRVISPFIRGCRHAVALLGQHGPRYRARVTGRLITHSTHDIIVFEVYSRL